MTEHMNEDVKRAIISRRSVRKFLPNEISKDIIKDILNVAARAPSGTNIQPWNVHVLLGESKNKVCKAASDAFLIQILIKRMKEFITWRTFVSHI